MLDNYFASNGLYTEYIIPSEIDCFNNTFPNNADFIPTQACSERISNAYKSSKFYTKGKILNINIHDPKINNGYYKFENFIYDKTNKIGSGGFSTVYKAVNKLDKKIYAIKEIPYTALTPFKNGEELLYREIAFHIMLNHPNIVRLYSYHRTKEFIYLILEYVENMSLFDKIAKENCLPEKKAFKYFIQVANALLFMHENKLIHRDIKPENILIDKNDNVKICDFGWCAKLNDKKTRHTFCGTFEYISPEMIRDHEQTAAVDIWALGILLYEMLHGYSPFRAQSPNKNDEDYEPIFNNILKKDYKIDKENELSKECIDMIHRLLEKDMKNRISANDIFKHPWIKKMEKTPKIKEISTEVIIRSKTKTYKNLEEIYKEQTKFNNINNSNNNKCATIKGTRNLTVSADEEKCYNTMKNTPKKKIYSDNDFKVLDDGTEKLSTYNNINNFFKKRAKVKEPNQKSASNKRVMIKMEREYISKTNNEDSFLGKLIDSFNCLK